MGLAHELTTPKISVDRRSIKLALSSVACGRDSRFEGFFLTTSGKEGARLRQSLIAMLTGFGCKDT